MDNTERIYNYMKSYTEEKGYPPTIKQIADDLNLKEYEAQEACDQLKESGRFKIADTPRTTTIEFVD